MGLIKVPEGTNLFCFVPNRRQSASRPSVIAYVSNGCDGRARHPPKVRPFVVFLLPNFLARALASHSFYLQSLPSCGPLPASPWPSLLPSPLFLPHSLMHTRPGGTMYIDKPTKLLVVILGKSTSTSVLTTLASPTTQSDLALAARLTSRLISCVLFVLGSHVPTHPHLFLDCRTQLSGNFSLLYIGRHV